MDIITTGTSKTSDQKLKAITDYIKTTLTNYQDRVNTYGIRYGNLFDLIKMRVNKGEVPGLAEKEFAETEFREALNVLEDDNYITLNGHTSAPVIRLVHSS